MSKFESMNMKFLNGEFQHFVIPKEHKFLYKYFKNKLQKAFIEYFYLMSEENAYQFQDHTGIRMTRSFICKLMYRAKALLELHKKAKDELDFDMLKKLERGECYIKEIFEIKEKNAIQIQRVD